MNEPGLTEREKASIRTKALELAVQMWLDADAPAFDVEDIAGKMANFIIEGKQS